jgi:hypothetical protein
MLIGHSQGGMQAVKVLHELAGHFDDSLRVYDPLKGAFEDRTTIVDPLTHRRARSSASRRRTRRPSAPAARPT